MKSFVPFLILVMAMSTTTSAQEIAWDGTSGRGTRTVMVAEPGKLLPSGTTLRSRTVYRLSIGNMT